MDLPLEGSWSVDLFLSKMYFQDLISKPLFSILLARVNYSDSDFIRNALRCLSLELTCSDTLVL